MANCRDGGTIMVGVWESGGLFETKGMTSADLATYDSDQIQEAINQHADPYVRSEVHRIPVDGKTFVAIVVHEFDEVPVICKKDGRELRRGAIYTRSYQKPETCEVRSQTEMREILELAVDKGVERFVKRAHAAGVGIEQAESEAEKFQRQLEGL